MSDSEIIYNKDGSLSALIGHDAVSLMRVQTVITGIRMNIQTGGKMQLTRGATITKLLAIAGEYTGKKYKRSEKQQAMDDLKVWFETMKAALPQSTRE